ncbi:hypothetical protein ACPA9J_26605 [Pseudomonas aeruginosa]
MTRRQVADDERTACGTAPPDSTLARLPRPRSTRAPKACAPAPGPRATGTPGYRLSYAISGVLGIHTAEGRLLRPAAASDLDPAQLEHEVGHLHPRRDAQLRHIRGDACAWAPTRCRVLEEVTPLARRLLIEVSASCRWTTRRATAPNRGWCRCCWTVAGCCRRSPSPCRCRAGRACCG